jgi:catechol 2,3-dioxygenase-like lactoylglutathione lyase family enzyme
MKRKRTAAEKRARRERKKKFMTIFVNGKQKRIPRPPLVEGLPVDEFIARNADPIWLHQNGLWELMMPDEEKSPMAPVNEPRTRFENSAPILKVTDMSVSLRYYIDVLGFRNADWGNDDFTSVQRDAAGIYLCRGGQGQAGTWVWIGVEDVEALYQEYRASGARIRHAPENYPWALEMKVADPDGHVLRFGSAPRADLPFVPRSG